MGFGEVARGAVAAAAGKVTAPPRTAVAGLRSLRGDGGRRRRGSRLNGSGALEGGGGLLGVRVPGWAGRRRRGSGLARGGSLLGVGSGRGGGLRDVGAGLRCHRARGGRVRTRGVRAIDEFPGDLDAAEGLVGDLGECAGGEVDVVLARAAGAAVGDGDDDGGGTV